MRGHPTIPIIRGASFPAAAFDQDVVSSNFLGRRLMIISRPEAVQHVLVANAANYVRPHAAVRVLSAPIGGGLFLAEGAEWRRQRRLLAPTFAPRANPHFMQQVAGRGERLVAELRQATPATMPLFGILQRFTLAMAAWALFSIEMEPYDRAVRGLSGTYAETLARAGMLDFLLPPRIPSLRDFRRRRFRRRWMAVIAGIVADRRQNRPAAPDLFETLEESETARGLFDQQVATLLVTGSETTGAALFWSCMLLARHPAIQDQVAAEAAALDLGPAGVDASMQHLVLTQAVVQEALRLYPPAFSIVRQALAADTAGGVPVPAGAIVQTAPWVLHRHRLLWNRPDEFDPARFMPGAPAAPRYAYLPFGTGARACIAAQFAQIETVLVVALLVRAFRIEPTTGRLTPPVAQITLQPDDPPEFRLSPRTPAG